MVAASRHGAVKRRRRAGVSLDHGEVGGEEEGAILNVGHPNCHQAFWRPVCCYAQVSTSSSEVNWEQRHWNLLESAVYVFLIAKPLRWAIPVTRVSNVLNGGRLYQTNLPPCAHVYCCGNRNALYQAWHDSSLVECEQKFANICWSKKFRLVIWRKKAKTQ